MLYEMLGFIATVVIISLILNIIRIYRDLGQVRAENAKLLHDTRDLSNEKRDLIIDLSRFTRSKTDMFLVADPRFLPYGTEVTYEGRFFVVQSAGALQGEVEYKKYDLGMKVIVHTSWQDLAKLTLDRQTLIALLREKCLEELKKVDTVTLIDALEDYDEVSGCEKTA